MKDVGVNLSRRIRTVLVLLVPLLFLGNAPPTLGLAKVLGAANSSSLGGTRPGPGALVQLEGSPAVVDVLYRYGQITGAKNGAYGVNLKAPRSSWYLEEQRAGSVDLYDGVVRQDPTLITEGLHVFHFGLAREAGNGSFPGSAWPFHGTALYLAEAAPSLIFLEHSRYASQFRHEVEWQVTRMEKAARYMVHKVGGPGHIDDLVKNHRRFEAALALGATGILSGDRALTAWSHIYIRQGIGMQRPDGVMPENGGHDSGYQAVGLTYATQYLALLATGPLRVTLLRTIAKGARWELSRIRSNGSINQTGDRRTVNCQERDPEGACKSVFAIPIAGSLARWSVLSGNVRYAQISALVWARATGSKLPTTFHGVPSAPQLPAGALGSVHSILRGLSVQPPRKSSQAGRLRMPLFTRYNLATKRRQRASMLFRDSTVLYLNQNTSAVLRSPTVTSLRRGEIDQIDGHGAHHQIVTANATTSAIGTNFDVRYDGSQTVVIVVQGKVTVANASGMQTVSANQESTVTGQQAPSAPTPVDAEAAIAWASGLHTWSALPGAYQAFGVASGPAGTIFVGENPDKDGRGAVRVISSSGTLLRSWSYSARRTSQGTYTDSMTADGAGHVFILDNAATVQEYSDRGTHLRSWRLQHQGYAYNSIAAGPDGNIYVMVYLSSRCASGVEEYSPTGNLLETIGAGQTFPPFCDGQALTVGPDGNIYVVAGRRVIIKLAPDGNKIGEVGPLGDGNALHWSMAVSTAGSIYQSYYELHSPVVRELSPDGSIAATWASSQLTAPGDTVAPGVGQIAVSQNGTVFLLDPANQRLKQLSP